MSCCTFACDGLFCTCVGEGLGVSVGAGVFVGVGATVPAVVGVALSLPMPLPPVVMPFTRPIRTKRPIRPRSNHIGIHPTLRCQNDCFGGTGAGCCCHGSLFGG